MTTEFDLDNYKKRGLAYMGLILTLIGILSIIMVTYGFMADDADKLLRIVTSVLAAVGLIGWIFLQVKVQLMHRDIIQEAKTFSILELIFPVYFEIANYSQLPDSLQEVELLLKNWMIQYGALLILVIFLAIGLNDASFFGQTMVIICDFIILNAIVGLTVTFYSPEYHNSISKERIIIDKATEIAKSKVFIKNSNRLDINDKLLDNLITKNIKVKTKVIKRGNINETRANWVKYVRKDY